MGLLRVLLAVGVVLSHTGGDIPKFLLVPSDVAVQGFYLISGFYIALVLDEKYNSSGDTVLFYKNRFLRIFIPYWVFLFLAVVGEFSSFVVSHRGVFAIMTKYSDQLGIHGLAYLIVSNLLLFGQDVSLFIGLDSQGLHWVRDFKDSTPPVFAFFFIRQSWSLAVELLFYVLAPFILRRSTPFIVAIIAASFAFRGYAYSIGLSQDPWSYRFFPFELAIFLAGSLSYRIYDRIREFNVGILKQLFSLCLIGAVLFFPFYDDKIDGFFSMSKIALYMCFFIGLPFLFLETKHSRHDRWIGELSYPIYLGHMLVAHAIHFAAPNWRSIVVIAVTILLSIGVVRFIEEPLDRYRQKIVKIAHEGS